MSHQEALTKQKVRTFLQCKRADKQIKQTKEKYKNLIGNIPDAIYFALPDETSATFISGRWKDWTGYSPDDFHEDFEILPKSIHPEDKDKAIQDYAQAHKEKKEYVFEYRVVHKDTGEVRYLRDHGVPVKNNKGEIVRFNGIITDITERKRGEEVLCVSEVRYRRLFESAKDGILLLDAETGTIVDANPFLIKMLGFSHEDFLGKAIWEIGCFKDIASNKDKFKELQRQRYIRYEDLPLETADGRRIEVEFVSNVYTVDHQKVIQCNIRDITERKQAEENTRNGTLC